ncbi:DNA mismatch repair protein MutL [Spironucleus salmonicida]|uniref:DNA mismatch repair protein MutL n=1 Tax=Spironucleus salmonicida TaxID=348837 RepID=V6LV69_9EUKA|nr:DNA mismatch repair protein MutL [Spironucleus salmonicida]|eukprot:EST47606.1 DNA mismatch repair protein MutL [Spironucleus salmonicida]
MIRELPTETKHLINASFQLKSPISIAKELLDNAIDANAKLVDLRITHDSVTITDDGPGFPEDLLKNITKLRLTTKSSQKIGFRGEALFAISNLADIIIESRNKRLSDGEMGFSDINSTRITVQNIFKNIPVRKRFFAETKNWKLEVKLNFRLFFAYALTYDIQLKVWLDSEIKFSTENLVTQRMKYQSIFSIKDNFVEIDKEWENFKLNGFLSNSFQQEKLSNLFIFINGKYIENEEIYQGLAQQFKKKSAIYKVNGCINYQIDSSRVDFNVSNDKLTVKIMGYKQLIDYTMEYYKECLENSHHEIIQQTQEIEKRSSQIRIVSPKLNLPSPIVFKSVNHTTPINTVQTQHSLLDKQFSSQSQDTVSQEPIQKINGYNTGQFIPMNKGDKLQQQTNSQVQQESFRGNKQTTTNQDTLRNQGTNQIISISEQNSIKSIEYQDNYQYENLMKKEVDIKYDFSFYENETSSETQKEISDNNIFNLNYIGQYNSSFLLCHQNSRLYILDQHALQEAVIFENLVNDIQTALKVQKLIQPLRLGLNSSQNFKLSTYDLQKLQNFGFEIVQIDDSFYLKTLPILDKNVVQLQDLIEYIEVLYDVDFPPAFQRILANRSCKTAVKLGDVLSDKTAKDIIISAKNSKNVLNCPHGRPTCFRLK